VGTEDGRQGIETKDREKRLGTETETWDMGRETGNISELLHAYTDSHSKSRAAVSEQGTET
jgi:hypothetical protein